MKKLALVLMVLLLCVALVACGDKPVDTSGPDGTDGPTVTDPTGGDPIVTPDDTHVHTNKTVAAVAATCTQAGLSEGVVCTDCGKTVVAQTATALAPHNYVDGKCKVCGASAEGSQGLAYSLDAEGNYVVDGIGECTDAQIVIPATHEGKPVVAISSGAFAENEAITQVVIPASVKKIGNNAFNRCVNLADVNIAEGVEVIGEKAFMYCIALESITVPDSVTAIQTGAFMACYNLVEATLGAGLEKISNDVFFECYSLEVVDIMSKLTGIGGWAFYDCDVLTTINYAGTDADWNKLTFGDYWDENSGAYNVACAGGKSVHKHVYADWYESGAKCEWARKCTKCSAIQTKYEHDTANAKWTFTSEGVINKCNKCGNAIDAYMKSDIILALDFDKPVSEQIADYPYFRLATGQNNKLEKDGDRTIWSVDAVTWLDYDKKAFNDLSYYSITFDMKVTANPDGQLRDNSVVSFVPGFNNGKQVGTKVGWVWQVKYVPVLGKLATKALNGTNKSTWQTEATDALIQQFEGKSADLPLNKWVTVDVVCDIEAKKSYIFVDSKPIGEVATFDYDDAGYGDAFTFRFCDVTDFGTKFDNFKIQAMTAK